MPTGRSLMKSGWRDEESALKIVVFGPEQRVGALQGDQIVDLHYAFAKYLSEAQDEPRPYAAALGVVPPDLAGLIESGPRAIEGAQRALEYLLMKADDRTGLRGERIVYPAGEVKLHPPLASRAVRIMMAGGNYVVHTQGMQRGPQGEKRSPEVIWEESRRQGIWGFWKIALHAVGPDEDVIYPARTQRLDYEGEVAVVLGRRGKDIPEGRARDYFWGYTLLVDWSIRDGREPPRALTFARAKNFDTSASIGPCIVVGEIPDPQDIPFETYVSGELRQRGNTRDMIFSFAEFLAYMSEDMTVLPGDIISGGTCAGTAMDSSERDAQGNPDPKLFIKPGDVVEVSSPSIGTLRNRVVPKPAG